MVALKGNQVEIQPATGGPTEMKHIKHVKYILPADRYINQLTNYSMFRRKTTLRMNPAHIPDLHWKLANTYHTTSIGYTEPLSTTYLFIILLWKPSAMPTIIDVEDGVEQF